MKKIFIILYVLTAAMFAQSPVNKLSDQLSLKLNNVQDNEQILIWIIFKDKGVNLQKYFTRPELVVSQKSLERRKKVFDINNLIDETDIPLYEQYLTQIENSGIKIKQKSKWFNSISAYANKTDIQKLTSFSFVKSVDIVYQLKKEKEITLTNNDKNEFPTLEQPQGQYLLDYGQSFAQMNQINVPSVHNLGYTGQGVTIAVMDAGFNRLSHEAFSTMNIIAKWDFVNNDPGVGDSTDMGEGSHGTQTLSNVGGYKSGQLIAPAFNSSFILAKTENTDSETPIEEDNWIAALEWADSLGADVTSTSLGYLSFDPPFTSYTWQNMDGNTCRITIAADLGVKKGIVIVNSAGNEGYNATHNTLGAPADGDSVISIGAVTSSGTRASFSSVGNTVDGRTKPDVMTLGSGNRVASPYSNTGYTTASGTSFSCPLAAGVAALILCAHPYLTPMQVRDAMRLTSSNSSSPNREIGWGILNALNAVNWFTPVELINFSAIKNMNSVILNWTTKSEKNNFGFEIEKSINKIKWNKLAYIEGKGTTTYENNYSYSDKDPIYETTFYRLKQIDFDGTSSYSNIIEVKQDLPADFQLQQNYPNPFNPETRIDYSISNDQKVSLKVFDLLGNVVDELVNEFQVAGNYSKIFNANKLSSGVYYYQLTAGNNKCIKKLVVMK